MFALTKFFVNVESIFRLKMFEAGNTIIDEVVPYKNLHVKL